MSTKYAVISQPMKGIDPDKVTSQREKAEAAVRAAGHEPIDTVYEEHQAAVAFGVDIMYEAD